MIRALIVDDDFRVASIHASYVEQVGGFDVIGQAYSGQATLDAVATSRPDVVLLDLYLPDIHGLDVLRRLRVSSTTPLDVIVITAANDTASVRAAMQAGALHYLLKPFGFPTLRDKLRSYQGMRSELVSRPQTDQSRIDKAYGVLRSPCAVGSHANVSPTLDAVENTLAKADNALSASDVAAMTGMSRATAQRYLTQLLSLGRATIALRYGTSGRPEHRYQAPTGVPGGPHRDR